MFRTVCLLLLTIAIPLSAEVERSILPLMDQRVTRALNGKVNNMQQQEMESLNCMPNSPLRVMSFNMLFNLPFSENQLEDVNKWHNRKERLIEYLEWSNADIIGSRRLQKDQLEVITDGLADRYSYYGLGVKDGHTKGDIPAIFYRKDRFELIDGRTYYFSETPFEVSASPFGSKNTFTVCFFLDLFTNQTFQVVNTHLAFGNIERRAYETKLLSRYLQMTPEQVPVIVTGDFNTFPFRQELDLPFYDGDTVIASIEQSGVRECAKSAIFGHFGPICSTNFNEEEKAPFRSIGTPGVILDHIFVSKHIQVVTHGIDPAQIDGYWPSDHFPVIADLQVNSFLCGN